MLVLEWVGVSVENVESFKTCLEPRRDLGAT